MSLFTALVLAVMSLTLFGHFVRTVVFLIGGPSGTITAVRDVLAIALAFMGLMRANPMNSPRLLWGLIIVFVSILIYLAIAAAEDAYLPGIYFSRTYLLPIFFMMALAGAITAADDREKENILKTAIWMGIGMVVLAIGLYGAALMDPAIAGVLISGNGESVLPFAWYIAGGNWLRMGLPAISPNALGFFMALNVLLMTLLIGRNSAFLKRTLPIIAALMLVTMLLTFSRSAMLMCMVGLLALWMLNQIHIPMNVIWATTVAGATLLIVAMIGVATVAPDAGDKILHWVELNLSGDDPSLQGHMDTFKDALDALPKFYLHGFDKGTVGPKAQIFTHQINHVENTFIGIFFDMGFFLGAFFMTGWGLMLSHFYSSRAQIAALAAFVVCAQFLPYYAEPDALISFVFVFALMGLVGDKTRRAPALR